MIKKTFLHIGCGPSRKQHTTRQLARPEWQEIRVDIDPGVNPDIVASMTDLSVIESQSVDAIFSSHNIEHVYAHEVPTVLAEFRRILKPTGFAIIICPNLKTVCRLVLEDKLMDVMYQSDVGPISPIDTMFGHRASLEQGNHFMAHKCGFTAGTLSNLITQAGFESVVVLERDLPQVDLHAITTVQLTDPDELVKQLKIHLPYLESVSDGKNL